MMLESKRLLFRTFEFNDYDGLYRILSNPNVCKYLPGEEAKKEDEIIKWLNHFIRSIDDEFGSKLYAVIEKQSNQIHF